MTAPVGGERCSAAARRRGDPLDGTAPPVRRWLLVEQPGPWGRDALRESRLPAAVAAALGARAAATGVRVLLIRRVGRDQEPATRVVGYVDSSPGVETACWTSVARPEELLELPLDGSVGTATTAPTYLVCAHGRHDVCCAMRGRPVAAALASLRPEQTWECSHVGGDRFAANVVVLPQGLYYGDVPAAEASRLVTATEADEVVPDWLRGRTGLPAAVQAAQGAARRRLGLRGRSDLAPLEVEPLGADRWRVRLAAARGPVEATVRLHRGPGVAALTCGALTTVPVPAWRVEHLAPTGWRPADALVTDE